MVASIQRTTYLDKIIERGVLFLLIFTPLAIGTVQPWSISIMEIAAFIVFGAWLLKARARIGGETSGVGSREPGVWGKTMIILLIGFALLIILQLVPLPPSVVSVLSPGTSSIYTQFSPPGDNSWRTLSIYPEASTEELFKLLAYAAVFIVIINHYRTREQVSSIIRTIVIMGCFLAVFAVVQKMTWNGNLFWVYPLREGLNPMGPYINRNHFAGYMEMAIPLALAMVLYSATRLEIPERMPFSERINAMAGSDPFSAVVFFFLSALVMSGALFMSLSRGGMLGFAAGLALFALMARSRRSLRKRTGMLIVAGLAIFVFVILAGWGRIEDRFAELGEETKTKRIEIWTDSMGIVRDFPLWGTGLGTFSDTYLRYQSTSPQLLFDHAHNDYIELLTDTGLVGFTLVMGMIGLFWHSLVKAWKERRSRFVTSMATGGFAAVAALSVHSITDFNLHIPANALLLTIIAAITYATVFNVNGGRSA